MHPPGWQLLTLLSLLLALGCGPAPLPPRKTSDPAPQVADARPAAAHPLEGRAPILVDSIHAHNYLKTGLEPGNYNYHSLYAYRRAFESLADRGFAYEEATDGQIDAARLAGRKMLFLNLVSADRPPFLMPEIAAIRDFVAGGGGLFVVTDHSNCYFHAHVLRPLFTELGLVTHTDTACEVPPHILGRGNGWITISRFEPHPVTRGLHEIAMQSGGRVDRRWAVALTSDEAWADRWQTEDYGHGDFPGYYGNWEQDPDEEAGPLGIVAAKDFGRGRIVVTADQNMLGDVFLNYADNYRLWLNSAAWLLGEPSMADAKPYIARRSPRVLLFEDYENALFGGSHDIGYHHALVLISRHYWTFTTSRLADVEQPDLIVFALDDPTLSPESSAAAAVHLLRGRHILVLDNQPGDPLATKLVKAISAALPEGRKLRLVEDTLEVTKLELPGGGQIRLLNSPARFDNYCLETPIDPPRPGQEARAKELLQHFQDLLPKAGSPH